MGFRFKRHEKASAGLRRIFTSELRQAAAVLLPAAGEPRDTSIHEARKSIKKTRSLLRLIQPQVGPACKVANARLGDAGRRLSAFRDAGAMLETLAALEQAYPEDIRQAKLSALRAKLTRDKTKAERAGQLGAVFEELAATLQAVAAHAEHWQLSGEGFDVLEPGFKKAFRRGRRALARAVSEGGDEHFHTWRKRVKEHWYHVRLLEPCHKELEPYSQQLRDLETWLGDDHNLVVLARNLGTATPLLTLAARRRDELRGKAVELGRKLYSVKPSKLTGRVHEYWDEWRS